MAKIRSVKYSDGTLHYLYNCPGCGWEHAFSPNIHTYNGDRDAPIISPSLLHNNPQSYKTCHSFIGIPGRNIPPGHIEFLGDCWHELKGKIVELPDYPAEQDLNMDFSKD